MRKAFLWGFICLCFVGFGAQAQQNLVRNPGFEQYLYCVCPCQGNGLFGVTALLPNATGSIIGTGAPGWQTPTSIIVPHYLQCNARGGSQNIDIRGRYIPRSGGGYIGEFIVYGPGPGRSYVQGELLQPLQAGCTYRVTFYARLLGSRPLSDNAIRTPLASDGLQAFLSAQRISCASQCNLEGYPAQVGQPAGVLLADTTQYVPVTGTFVAQGGEQYITIGNFRSDAATSTRRLGSRVEPVPTPSRYALDDVSVVAVPPDGLSLALPAEQWLGNCGASTGRAVLAAGPGFTAYRWSTGETTRAIAVAQPGVYWVEGDFGCGTIRDSVTVRRYNPTATPLLGLAPILLCPGETVTAVALPGFQDYQWADGPTGPSRAFNQAGRYRLQARTADGCLVQDSLRVQMLGAPPAPPNLPADTLVCADEPLLLQVPALPGLSYQWSNGVAGNSLQIPAGSNGVYRLTLRNRCQATTSVSVQVRTRDCAALQLIPNVITPNGDGVNDFFRVQAPTVRPLRLQMFNRWGREVYQSTDYQGDWPQSAPPAGLYYFLLTDDKYQKRYRGWLEVVP